MMENNTFRMYMLVAGIVVGGVAMSLFFLYPVKPVPAVTITTYEKVMNERFDAGRKNPDGSGSLTSYEMAKFYVKGMVRGNTRHY